MHHDCKKEVFLVDSDDKLARLLALKLKSLGVRLRHIRPSELDDLPQPPLADARESAVIIDLPQKGTSDGKLLERVAKIFPGLLLIKFLTPGTPAPDSNRENEHSFVKPLLDLTPFLDLIIRPSPPPARAGPPGR
ncbi:MAG: hypothetical protein V1816_23800 [Pseudomonadota bacterium]